MSCICPSSTDSASYRRSTHLCSQHRAVFTRFKQRRLKLLPCSDEQNLPRLQQTCFKRSARLYRGRQYFIIIIINPLTARVVGAPQMILQPDFPIFPCSPLPSGTCRTPGSAYASSKEDIFEVAPQGCVVIWQNSAELCIEGQNPVQKYSERMCRTQSNKIWY